MRAEHASRITDPYWGVPDLAVEVVSPGTRRNDCVIKVREYAEGACPRHAAGGSGDSVTSPTLPGFEVAVSDALGAR